MSAPSGFDPSVSLLQQNASAPIQPFRGGGGSLDTFYQGILTRLSEEERKALPKKIKELTNFAISVKDGTFVLKMKVKGEKETEPLLPPEIQKAVDIVTAAANKAEQSAERANSAAALVEEGLATFVPPSSDISEGKTGESGEGSSTSGLQSSAISEATTAEAIALIAASEAVNQAKEVMEARKDVEILRKARYFLILEAARAFLRETSTHRDTNNFNPDWSQFIPTPSVPPPNYTKNLEQFKPAERDYESKTSDTPSPPPLSSADKAKKHEAILNAYAADRSATNMIKKVEGALNNIKLDKPNNSNNEATKALLKEIQEGILELNRVAGEVQTKAMTIASTTTVADAETAASNASEKANTMRSIQQNVTEKIEQVARIRQRKKVVNNAVAAAAAKTSPTEHKPPNIKRGNIGKNRRPLKRVQTTFNMESANQNRRLKDTRNALEASKKTANNALAAAKKRVNNALAAKKQPLVNQANEAVLVTKDVVAEVDTALKTNNITEQNSNSPATKKVLEHIRESIPGLQKASNGAQRYATETASATTVKEATEAADKAKRLGVDAIVIKESILHDLERVSKAREKTN